MGLAVEMGMAKPMPSIWVEASLEELMPTTWPYLLISAPPELPGLMAASTWMASISMVSLVSSLVTEISRFRPETMPWVTEPARFMPVGLPMATMRSPTTSSSELPNSAAVRFSASILTTATSVFSSMPTTVASYSSSLSRMTRMPPVAPDTTWALVTM